jgi:hypothetical protein
MELLEIAPSVRQLLNRASPRFRRAPRGRSRVLDTTEPDQVVEELINLGLMGYCRSAVGGAERLS